MARLLFHRFTTSAKLQSRNMSQAVIIYMLVHLIGSAVTLPHHFYLMLLWKPAAPIIVTDEPLYDPYILYLSGIFMVTYFYTPAVPVFFLTLERCIALKYPIQYHNRSKTFLNKLPSIATIATVVWCVIVVMVSIPDSPMDMTKVKYCLQYGCINASYHGKFQFLQQYMKSSISIANVLCTVYFLYALRMYKTYSADGKHFALKNRIVIVTCLSEILLNVSPIVCGTLFHNITGESPGNILGNDMILLFTLDAVICSLYYTKMPCKIISACLILCFTVSVIKFGESADFCLYLGVVNGYVTDLDLKLRELDSSVFDKGSTFYSDYKNAMAGNFTAMKTLVGNQLGVKVSNLFYRDYEKKLREIQNDDQLKSAKKMLNFQVYACKEGTPCFYT
ncbi:hypothetical protein DdX_17486 [Ditylenchus destructor]|uniref:Uncharacterized protein n=1 Tax=Ditylenchus destructor TaxID=166010 RepID=A0AAD4QVR2_9BILA|nr:hypothetical protein DdX_17486 [Ditylenchus destructor]